jgi:hypothetical protein
MSETVNISTIAAVFGWELVDVSKPPPANTRIATYLSTQCVFETVNKSAVRV